MSGSAGERLNQWSQTIVVLLTILSVAIGGVRWIEAQNHELRVAILKIQSVHELDKAAIVTRLTLAGWSRQQQQSFTDSLREFADHPIPSLAKE